MRKTLTRFGIFDLSLATLPMIVELLAQPHGVQLGIQAQDMSSWPQLFTAAFAHANTGHLVANLSGFWLLGFVLFQLHPKQGRLLFWAFPVLTTFLVWLWARPAVHLGASGWVFALAGALLFWGLKTRNPRTWAVAGMVLILQSGIFVGLFPVEEGVSWESHLSGFVLGGLSGWLWLEKPVEEETKSNLLQNDIIDYHQGYRPIETEDFKYVYRE
ncbi:MAG: rhomboid family intramembrane serine protease [Bacteroidota bacterium]